MKFMLILLVYSSTLPPAVSTPFFSSLAACQAAGETAAVEIAAMDGRLIAKWRCLVVSP